MHVHKPVMLKEVLRFLAPVPSKRYLDATVGAGGHSRAILEKIVPGGMLIALDRDSSQLTLARDSFKEKRFPEKAWRLFHLSYKDMDQAAAAVGLSGEGWDGILFDLGVSSLHLDDPERGFSFLKQGPLDFRFDRSQSLTGKQIINTWTQARLRQIFREYGNERNAAAIARRICKVRQKNEITTTLQLAEIVRKAIPPRFRTTRRNPATLVFQAIRMSVNNELEILEQGLSKALAFLAVQGVCVVISFHSGEDRIVKLHFRKAATKNRKDPEFEILTKKPLTPSKEEARENPRARSAKFRAIKRLRKPGAPPPEKMGCNEMRYFQ